MNSGSHTGRDEDLMKTSNLKERPRACCEGMDRDEISLGAVEDELYFGRKEKGVFLLQRA